MPPLPSEKQLAYARGLADKQSEPLPPEVEVDAAVCSAYIEAMKNRPLPPSSAQLDYAREIYDALAEQISLQAYERALVSAAACSEFIKQRKLDFLPSTLVRELSSLDSSKERFDALEAYRQRGGGFSGLDPSRLVSIQQKLIGYWLEGLQSTAFEGLGKLDNLLGEEEKASFDIDKLHKLL